MHSIPGLIGLEHVLLIWGLGLAGTRRCSGVRAWRQAIYGTVCSSQSTQFAAGYTQSRNRPISFRLYAIIVRLKSMPGLTMQYGWQTDLKSKHSSSDIIQYWPKVTHAMKRASHVGCNACNARIQRVLHRPFAIWMSRMNRASSVQHMRDICAGCT
jgi:hypothetical protein